MFSSNVKQFGIRHILIGTVFFAIAMGLIATQWSLAVMLGILILVGFAGGFLSYAMMFMSDLLDDRRIDDRNWRSRFFNFIGLLIVLATIITVILLGVALLLRTGIWLLNRLP